MESVVILAISLCALGSAWFAARYTYNPGLAAITENSINSAEVDPSPEKSRAAKIFQERRFIIFFLVAVFLGTGIVAHFIFTNTVSYVDIFKIALAYSGGLAAMVIDIKYHRIPNLIPLLLLGGRVLTIGYEFLFRQSIAVSYLMNSALGLVICFVFLALVSKALHNGIGMGDVKLISAIGFLCGIYAVCSILLFALLASCVISIFLLVTKVKKIKDYIPFGPFIFIGIFCTILLGTF